MENVSVVIGASFGDEGKGHIVDYFAARYPGSLVVRFNGGAQAGHTVVTPDGHRHVFHHFGSGTLAGAPTYLSRYFLVHPMVFVEELAELRKVVKPKVYVDPDALVSTPFDMMLNQAQERRRGPNRHGSCGLGIWETELRSKVAPLRVSDLFGPKHLWRDKLVAIREVYVPERMQEVDLTTKDLPWLLDEGLFEHFVSDCEVFTRFAEPKEWHHLFVDQFAALIYEGAQGLRLDQDNVAEYPYVSGSRTGLRNALQLQEEIGFPEFVHAWYVTRPYLTRHGVGPLHHECTEPPFKKIRDDTNIWNTWQGNLRFAYQDLDDLLRPIKKDLKLSSSFEDCAIFPHVAVTCCDHVDDPDRFTWFQGRQPNVTTLDAFTEELRRQIFPYITMLMCHGPNREDVARLETSSG